MKRRDQTAKTGYSRLMRPKNKKDESVDLPADSAVVAAVATKKEFSPPFTPPVSIETEEEEKEPSRFAKWFRGE